MPNTLAHLAVNGILGQALFKKSDLVYIYLGAIIPDIPWIIQRIVLTALPAINRYDLRLYSIAASSFLFTLILCLAFSVILKQSKRTFFIFAFGSLIHLLLDSIETKWGNGVHFLAPFNWDLLNFGLFWPESFFIYIITVLGFIYVILNWKSVSSKKIIQFHTSYMNFLIFIICLSVYFLLPFLYMQNAELNDNHYVKTLRTKDYRTGKYFESDRGNFVDDGAVDKFITTFSEELTVSNINLDSSEKMSVRARFKSNSEIEIIEYHIHSDRDIFSYIGLLLILLLVINPKLNFRKIADRIKLKFHNFK